MDSKLVLIVDGHALVYRAYYAFINHPLTSPQGDNISAIYGFFSTVFSLMESEKPDCLVAVFDAKGPTFRHEKYPDYKATRKPAPEDLHQQVDRVIEILTAMNVPLFQKSGYEADDIIGTIAKRESAQGNRVRILSGDKDLMQLVDQNVHMLRPQHKGPGNITFDPAMVEESMGVRPDQIIDYLSLVGDSSDNVPGVSGVGAKGAAQYLQKYGTLEMLYEKRSELTPKQREKLEQGWESAQFSKFLVTLVTDVDMDLDISGHPNFSAAVPFFESIDSKRLITVAKSLGSSQGGEAFVTNNEPRELDFSLITTGKKLEKAVHNLMNASHIVVDSLMDGSNSMESDLIALSLTTSGSSGIIIPLQRESEHLLLDEGFHVWQGLPISSVTDALKPLFHNPKITFICHNFSEQRKALLRVGIDPPKVDFDTIIAGWLLGDAQGFSIDDFMSQYLQEERESLSAVTEKKPLREVSVESVKEYVAHQGAVLFELYEIFSANIKQQGMEAIFSTLEMPVVTILSDMEYRGIYVDKDILKEEGEQLRNELSSLEQEIYRLCGKEFNLNSTQQLQEVLFEERGLPKGKKTKTGYSTDTTVLEALAPLDPVPRYMLRFRVVSKLLSTYVEALPNLVNPKTGRLHTTFVQTGTATGRLSSRNPNLQNIPIRTDEGRAVRRAFVASPGKVFISADYAQIELVLLAHLSQDENLIGAFTRGDDVHATTGSLIFGVPSGDITSEQRRIAKTINFGIMYGMSPFRLSRELGITLAAAKEFITAYFREYDRVKSFFDDTLNEAVDRGFVETLRGRRRSVRGLDSSNGNLRKGAERSAINTRIQGSAADVVKEAMLQIDRWSEKSGGVDLLLQVHDELLFEVDENLAEPYAKEIQSIMEKAVPLSLPLRVSVEIGKSWGDFH